MGQNFLRNLSHWERNTFFKGIDLLVIGGGIVGMCAALEWKWGRPEDKVVILERDAIPAGASTRNAGFACFGSMTELLDDLNNGSEAEMLNLVEKRWKGLQRLKYLVGEKGIAYNSCGGYELFRPGEEMILEEVLDSIPRFNRLLEPIIGHPATFIKADDELPHLGFKGVKALIKNQFEGAIDTGAMVYNLTRKVHEAGVLIFNGLEVEELGDQNEAVRVQLTNHWTLSSQRVLVTVNGFARQILPEIGEVKPARNQVLITQPIPGLLWRGTFHYDRGYFYFRNVGNRVLLGGGRNLDALKEETSKFGTTEKIRSALSELLSAVILPHQNHEIDIWWSGIMGVGDQKAPIVKRVSQRVGVAVRLGGMGVAIGSLIGQEAAQMMEEAI